MPKMNNIIQNHSSKIMKIQNYLPPKLAIALEKQTVLGVITVFQNALLRKCLLVQLLINITMALLKIFSKNVTETIHILLEINLVKRMLKGPSTYGN